MLYFKETVACAQERDPASPGFWGVALTYAGVHALLLHRLAHSLWRREFYMLARFVAGFSRFLTSIEIHPAAKIGRRLFIDHGCGVVIGETAEVGNNCTLYHGVTLGGVDLDRKKRHPTLEDNVIVGAGAKVLGPFRVGAGARIGSNAVVLEEVPDGATVVGIPGRIITASPGPAKESKKARYPSYAVTDPDCCDPLEEQIASLRRQIEELEGKLDSSD